MPAALTAGVLYVPGEFGHVSDAGGRVRGTVAVTFADPSRLDQQRMDEAVAEVRERDEQIDALYTSLFRELLTYMMEDPRNITACTHLLFMAKNLERIGDHATNIAEEIVYLYEGRDIRHQSPNA